MHIAVAGNIGSGKTTLTSQLAKHFKWDPHYEDADDNPYLNDFYEDMQRWSFNLQMYFLNTRFKHVMKIRESKKTVVQDRTIYEDAFIFAPNLHSMGLMTTRDFNDYLKRLNERYEAWITNYEMGKLLVIDIDHINFAEKPEDLGDIINKINSQINGLF